MRDGANTNNSIKIIGGKWRGRKLCFVDNAEVRPTPNRVRETLFNWLAPVIAGARCLDLFAGSGALGFEALSRGAGQVVMVDRSAKVLNELKHIAADLSVDNVKFYSQAFSPDMANIFADLFDIVFLDPPFKQGLVAVSLDWLLENAALAPAAFVYVEAEKGLGLAAIADARGFTIYRHKQAGLVQYALLRKTGRQESRKE